MGKELPNCLAAAAGQGQPIMPSGSDFMPIMAGIGDGIKTSLLAIPLSDSDARMCVHHGREPFCVQRL